jgi:hypothetical protein
MSTHEIKASDLTWAEINFESPKEAFKFADKLEQKLKDPNLTEEQKKQLDDCLDDLFSTLFDGAF